MCHHVQVTSPLELNLLAEKDYFKLLVSTAGRVRCTRAGLIAADLE